MKFRGITIQKRTNCNTWYARYRKNGKQFYISAKTQQDCYNKLKLTILKKTKEELKQISYQNEEKKKQPKAKTLLEWFNIWQTTYRPNASEQTLKDYQNSLNHLKNLQNEEITKITSLEITQELNGINKPRAKQKVYEFLVMLFDKAFRLELIQKNPTFALEKPAYTRKNGEAFTLEDEQKFIEICKNKKLDIFLVGLYQGMRRGEILALTNNDIDFEQKTININKSLQSNGKFGKTKNNSDRIVPIFENTYKILENYKNKQGRLFEYSYKQAGKLFEDIEQTYFAGKKYTPKTLRYTFITKCQEWNIPEHIIQKWVGHKKGSKVTRQVYTRIRTSAEIENIELYNKKLNSN